MPTQAKPNGASCVAGGYLGTCVQGTCTIQQTTTTTVPTTEAPAQACEFGVEVEYLLDSSPIAASSGGLVAGVIIGVLLALIIGVLLFVAYRRRRNNPKSDDGLAAIVAAKYSAPVDSEIDPAKITIVHAVGVGVFGTVYLANYKVSFVVIFIIIANILRIFSDRTEQFKLLPRFPRKTQPIQ